MRYTNLSLAEVSAGLHDVARDARSTFGALDERQLNWKPDAARWSIAQCFDHLLKANQLMLAAAERALENPSKTVWQRLPLWSAAFGWIMVRSQGPKTLGKFTAPVSARPATSQIPGDIIQRFVDQHRHAEAWARALDPSVASRTIMTSPFVKEVTYSVLNGLRLMVAHDRRHFEQARRVLLVPSFSR